MGLREKIPCKFVSRHRLCQMIFCSCSMHRYIRHQWCFLSDHFDMILYSTWRWNGKMKLFPIENSILAPLKVKLHRSSKNLIWINIIVKSVCVLFLRYNWLLSMPSNCSNSRYVFHCVTTLCKIWYCCGKILLQFRWIAWCFIYFDKISNKIV